MPDDDHVATVGAVEHDEHVALTFADGAAMRAPLVIGADGLRFAQKMIGDKEKWLNLETHIPVHISYFTLRVDDDISQLQALPQPLLAQQGDDFFQQFRKRPLKRRSG